MRIFGPAADRIGRLMDRLDVEPIEHRWVANSIEGAQKKVEGMNFDTRKHVVEYDNVMNIQRAIIYGERNKILSGANTRENILDYIREVIAKGVDGHCQGRHPENWDLEGLVTYLGHYFPIASGTVLPESALSQGQAGLTEYLYGAAVEAYAGKEEQLGDEELRRSVERFVMLRTVDQKWVDYLTTMEHFREGIGLQAYGQKDPLVEYKNEAHTMFEELTDGIRADIVANMFRVQVMPHDPPPQPKPVHDGGASPPAAPAASQVAGPGEPVGVGAPGRKLGRNDLCWCGSGRKYKRCHGR
jgi:preprotein translocase subunit SecA